uniref:Peptidase_M13_N domain-containing protein n=1 Tax=Caenorhabditis tropicalis TaxID=1561998 RepID=A0A1I7T126_9PELO
MRFCTLFFVLFFVLNTVSHVGTQQAFGSVSYPAIQRIIPHATNANAFALAQGLNQNIGKYAPMRTLVNQFFNQNKAGKPNPKTLSLYDNSTYSRQKLIALVNNVCVREQSSLFLRDSMRNGIFQRQAVTQWWDQDLTPGLTKIYNAATATNYKNLYAYFDSRYINSYSYTLVYWMLTVLMKEMWDDVVYNKTSDLIINTLEARLNKSTLLAFEIYTEAFEANHNQTYMKGKW